MKSAVMLTHDRIQLVVYDKGGRSFSMKKAASVPLEDGAVINGVITDAEEVQSKLVQLYRGNAAYMKSVTLVIDSGEIIIRKIPTPKLKKYQYNRLVDEDLKGNVGDDAQLAFGYSFLPAKTEDTVILACAATRDFLDSYRQVFSKAGIRIEAVHPGFQSLVGIARDTPDYREQGVVVNLFDGMGMLSVLFENGNLVFSKRTRVLGDDEGEMADFIVRELSQMTQFTKAQGLAPVTKSLYRGIPESLIGEIGHRNIHGGIAIQPFLPGGRADAPETAALPPLLLCTMAAGGQDKIDLLPAVSGAARVKKERKPVNPAFIWYPALILVLAATFGLFKYLETGLEEEAERLRWDTVLGNLPDTVSEIAGWETEIGEMQNSISDARRFEEMILQTHGASEALMAYIEANRGTVVIDLVEYNADRGELVLNCTGANRDDPARYAASLRGAPGVKDVVYPGYSTGDYKFKLTLVLGESPSKSGEATGNE